MFSPVIKLPFVFNKRGPQYKTQDESYFLFFDGCSKGNPGPGGAGAVLYKDGLEIWADSAYVGSKVTNNESEYTGLVIGLSQAIKLGIQQLNVHGDSLLVIKQINGEYKVSSKNLLELYKTAKLLETHFEKVNYMHVYRENNKRADQLSNEGLTRIADNENNTKN
jgi:ribonuclease HI